MKRIYMLLLAGAVASPSPAAVAQVCKSRCSNNTCVTVCAPPQSLNERIQESQYERKFGPFPSYDGRPLRERIQESEYKKRFGPLR